MQKDETDLSQEQWKEQNNKCQASLDVFQDDVI
jgi:hypothetical protein